MQERSHDLLPICHQGGHRSLRTALGIALSKDLVVLVHSSAPATEEHGSYLNVPYRSRNYATMQDNITTSDSSRGASPFSNDMHRDGVNASCSITELSQQFDQHTLEPRRPASYARSPSSQSHHLHSTLGREPCSSVSKHHAPRRPRECMIRRQCSAASMSRLSSLVHDLLRDGSTAHNTAHVSPLSDTDSVSPLSSHGRPRLGSPTTSFASNSSCSEDGEFEPQRSSWIGPAYKLDKHPRRGDPREAGGRQFKDIRVRKASRRKCPTLAS